MINKSLSVERKEKPKICAIDLEPEIVEALKAKGLHCFTGTLGSQIKVPNISSDISRLNQHNCLLSFKFPPNLHEYDIVIVDLKDQEPIEYIESEHTHSSFKGSRQFIYSSRYPETIFDPRPLSSLFLLKQLEDFFSKETLIIVFCSANETCEYHPIIITRDGSREQNPVQHSLYEFIPDFSRMYDLYNKMGKNLVVSDIGNKDIKNFFQKYCKKFAYETVFKHPHLFSTGENRYIKSSNFVPLLLNSNNEITGFVDSSLKKSTIFAFPQLRENKKDFLLELVDELLPGLFPKIFPYSEQLSWLKLERYFLPGQASFLKKKSTLEDEYKSALSKIDEEFERNQNKYKFLHQLITETGSSLVKAVEYFLGWLGFEHVVNMDEANPEIKEEDIQILLDPGLLVIEIKGIGGTSKDSECSQIDKIKNRRNKARSRFDVSALYVVNHQRYIDPVARKNPPFNEQQVADAQAEERGLLTTYEIYKSYFNIEKGFLTKEDVKLSLLEFGLVQFNPSKSTLLGSPLEVHHKGQVVILNISGCTVNKGASIIVCNDDAWFGAEVIEIKLNDETVESASDGEVGIRLSHSVLKTSLLWLKDTGR
jgi:hypothetical protein